MTITLVTVRDVPIVSTGTYQLASGETTFSAEDLADAVRAGEDPTIPAPRLKLGHTDPRFEEAIASGELDGEPAFGTVQNLRLSPDGQTVLGDYCDVPEWLAETLPSSYPGRSIEGGFGYTAPSGRQYRLVIARVALLGITWPGVTSLSDLREVLEQNGEVQDTGEVEASADRFVCARIARPGDHQAATDPQQHRPPAPAPPRPNIAAGLDLGNVRMQFCGDLDSGEVPQVPDEQPQADDVGPQVWWWPRSVRVEDDGSLCLIVDDDEGHLIRIPFTVQQGDLMYGTPELVIETYVPVTSDPDDGAEGQPVTARGPRVLASWPVRAASRPSTPTEETTTMRINGSDVDTAALRTRLGLADDATEQAIADALGITLEPSEPAAPAPEPEPVAASGRQVPDGMVLVDADTFEQVRDQAQQGAQVAARLAEADRDQTIQAAINDGKIPVGSRGRYVELWNRDVDGTRHLLTAAVNEGGLAAGVIPVGAREHGRSGDGEGQPAAAEAEHDGFMARHFPNEHGRLHGGPNGRARIRQEA